MEYKLLHENEGKIKGKYLLFSAIDLCCPVYT